MSEPQPLRQQFDREIEELVQRLKDLSQAVESAILQATRALVDQNAELAEYVIIGETAINTATYEIEDYVNTVVAREQPVATDLRFIITTLHVVIALERDLDDGTLIYLHEGGRHMALENILCGLATNWQGTRADLNLVALRTGQRAKLRIICVASKALSCRAVGRVE